MKRMGTLCAVVLFAVSTVLAGNVVNYSRTTTVNDIVVLGDTLLCATSGGMYLYDVRLNRGALITEFNELPDVNIMSIAKDPQGYFWVATKNGYLCKWRIGQRPVVYSSYAGSSWDITTIKSYLGYILVGSSKGLSIFDPLKGEAKRNALRFNSFTSSRVNAIELFRDTLFLGCQDGIASIGITSNWIDSLNFYDQTIWNTRKTTLPVIAFVKNGTSLQVFDAPAMYKENQLVLANKSKVTIDGDSAIDVQEQITKIVHFSQGFAIATDGAYFWLWDGGTLVKQVAIPGLASEVMNRITVDIYGNVWVAPLLENSDKKKWDEKPLWEGIYKVSNNTIWTKYDRFNEPNLQFMSESNSFDGLCAMRNGNIYFGLSGGNVKCYDPASGWRQYYVSGQGGYSGFRVNGPDEYRLAWGGCYSIAQDSSGLAWISSFGNFAGCLVAYDISFVDPNPDHYKRFFPKSDPNYYLGNVTALGCAKNGKIAAGSDDGKMCIFSLTDASLAASSVRVHAFLQDGVNVRDISVRGTTAYFATSNGCFVSDLNLSSPTFVKDEAIGADVISIEAESDSSVWLGTSTKGLVHYNPATHIKKMVGLEDGISQSVNDLYLDRSKAILWMATTKGISKYDLERSIIPITSLSSCVVYPNPVSLKAGTACSFIHVPANTTISIRSLNGQAIGVAQPVVESSSEWRFTWQPSRTMQPGVYVYVVAKKGSASRSGKILIVP